MEGPGNGLKYSARQHETLVSALLQHGAHYTGGKFMLVAHMGFGKTGRIHTPAYDSSKTQRNDMYVEQENFARSAFYTHILDRLSVREQPGSVPSCGSHALELLLFQDICC
jgi:hypothetical protein